jgi:hypothetical protein
LVTKDFWQKRPRTSWRRKKQTRAGRGNAHKARERLDALTETL